MLVESTEATRDLGGTEGATKAVKKTPDFEPSREAGLSHIIFVGAGGKEIGEMALCALRTLSLLFIGNLRPRASSFQSMVPSPT